ncbi:MAG: tRNA (adenine-N1)-methyltransferase [Aeriscardovia sp.]|nr:tRNA (adenine-N1)-methyltransferase [Aeriscardovia sp.]
MQQQGQPFCSGEKVQLTDSHGKKITIQLCSGVKQNVYGGVIAHDVIIGCYPGCHVRVSNVHGDHEYTVFRPRLMDYQLSMPRGPQIIYPKDIAQILSYGDIHHGMRVLESGGGSGSLTLSLLDTVGETGLVTTVERDEQYLELSSYNIELYFQQMPAWWNPCHGDFETQGSQLMAASYDRVVLDLAEPWLYVQEAARLLIPGGIAVFYVTTVPQIEQLIHMLEEQGGWFTPEIVECVERTWKCDGRSIRPNHQMIAHTGFIITSRRMSCIQKDEASSSDNHENSRDEVSSRKALRKTLRSLQEQVQVVRSTRIS